MTVKTETTNVEKVIESLEKKYEKEASKQLYDVLTLLRSAQRELKLIK